MILENTVSEGKHIYPGVNVNLWQLACNHQSLAGPASDTNICKQFRGAVPRIFDAVHYGMFTWVNGNCVQRDDRV